MRSLSKSAIGGLLAGTVLLLAGLAVTLLGKDLRPIAVDYAATSAQVAGVPAGNLVCQPQTAIARDAAALKLFIVASPQPTRVRAELPTGQIDQALAGASARAGAWVTIPAGAVTAAVPLPRRESRDQTIVLCLRNEGPGPLALLGQTTGPEIQARVAGPAPGALQGVGRARVDSLGSSEPVTALSMLPRLPERIHAAAGSALAPWLAIVGGLAALVLLAVFLARPADAGGRDRGDLAVLAALTLATGGLWAGVTPLLHQTDEQAHVAYVQSVVELGHPPRTLVDDGLLSAELACWYDRLGVPRVRFAPDQRPAWTREAARESRAVCATQARTHDGAQYHAMQPPLYYLVAQVPYRVASGSSLPNRVLLMRLFSALLMVVTAVATYLLVRELVPGSRWAARLGGLAITLQPVLMFNGIGVNPDAAMVSLTSVAILVAARAWRRGLSWRRAITFGMVTGALLISKTNALTVLPALAVLLAVLVLRPPRDRASLQPRVLRGAAAAAIVGGWFAAYAAVNTAVWDRGLTYRQGVLQGGGANLPDFVNRTWQFFLPPLPGTTDLYPEYVPVLQQMLYGTTGRLGWWNDFGIPEGLNIAVLVAAAAILAAAAVYVVPRARRHPWPAATALLVLLAFGGTLMAADYQFSLGTGASTIHNRHVFPAIALWGLAVGCAVAAIPERRRAFGAGLLASALLAHTVIALAAMINRFSL